MKERPILFSGAMVRALLDGRKTQSRRVVKPQPEESHDGEPYWHVGGYRAWQSRPNPPVPLRAGGNLLSCPYGTIGDRLWVRETFAHGHREGYDAPPRDGRPGFDESDPDAWNVGPCWFRATDEGMVNATWRPSIHMPRWASRLTLEITGVRVERVQDISPEDALAEGIAPTPDHAYPQSFRWLAQWRVGEYASLWDSINGARPGCSWADNPWVWVLEFRRVSEEATHG